MRIERRNVLLLVLAAASAGAHFALRAPERRAAVTPALFAGFDPAEVRRVEAERTEEDGEVRRLVLQRVEGRWTLPELHGARAHGWSVDALLAGLADVRDADLVSERADSWPLYGVGGGGTRVRVVGAGGVTLASFVQGRPLGAPGSGVEGTFLRPRTGLESGEGGGDAVYRAGGLGPIPVDPGHWLDTRVVAMPPEAVRRIEIDGPGGGPARLARRAGEWTATGDGGEPLQVSGQAVGGLLAEVSALHYLEPTGGAEADAFDPEWRLVLSGDGETELRLSRSTGEGRRTLERSAEGRTEALAISEAAARELVRAAERVRAALDFARSGR